MGFITLLSQLPLENSYIQKNLLVVLSGFILYLIVGTLIYTDRFPSNILSSIPDKRYLLLVVAIDLALFVAIYRFQHGAFPSFSSSKNGGGTESNRMITSEPAVARQLGGGSNSSRGHMNGSNSGKRSSNKNVSFAPAVDVADDTSSWANGAGDINLDNDLESTFKRPGIHNQSELPEEVSIPGGNYFNDESNTRPKVENWEVDEFTNTDFDQTKDHMMID